MFLILHNFEPNVLINMLLKQKRECIKYQHHTQSIASPKCHFLLWNKEMSGTDYFPLHILQSAHNREDRHLLTGISCV